MTLTRRPRPARLTALAALAFVLAALVPMMTPPAASAATPIRVMLLGDSITRGDSRYGSAGIATFRYYLWKKVQAAGYNVDFVGSTVGVNPEPDNPQGLPLYPDFDQDNEGHSGYWACRYDNVRDPLDGTTIMDVCHNAARWVSQAKADVVLLHIGTNDLRYGTSATTIRDSIRADITAIRNGNPNAKILLAKIIPTGGWDVSPFNSLLPAVASSMTTSTSPVVIVDQFTGFSVTNDTIDTIHANSSGEQKMANVWFAGLSSLLGPAPATLPDPPTNVVATPGNGSATVSWTPPSGPDAALITSYTVTPSNGIPSVTVSGSVTSTVVTGLTNGTSYTFSVIATNPVGTSGAATSSPVVPARPPDAPTGVSATPGNASVAVGWTPPQANGGSPITSYVVTAAPGGATATAGSSATSATVTGLTNGTTYTFTVAAVNAMGPGAPSAPSAAVKPGTTPSAPSGVAATAEDRAATVTWSPPSSDGGWAVSSYTVTATPGGASLTAASTATSARVSGLTNGISYTFTVSATNVLGRGATSLPSPAVIPAAAPGPPGSVSATARNASVTVAWSPPADNGGRPVTGYSVTVTPGGRTVTAPSTVTAVVVDGLTNGVVYSFSVAAVNAVGTGAAAPSVTARPLPTFSVVSPNPTPRVASGPRLTLVSTTTWGPDAAGALHVVGEVRNDDSVAAGQLAIGLVVYDAANAVLQTRTVSVPVLALGPGDRTPFEATIDAGVAVDHVDVPWVSSTAGGVVNHRFATVVTSDTFDPDGTEHVGGTVTNQSTATVASTSVVATLTSSDVAIGTASAPAGGTGLAPGASAPFSLTIPPDRPARTDLRLVAQSPTPPTPSSPPPSSVQAQGAGLPVDGYWLVASDGGIFSFGNRQFLGSTGNIHLNQPIVGMAGTPTHQGYWLVASDGGIFAFGDAAFYGSTGNIHLNRPIVGMASTPSGGGYWLVASDGGIFAFGDAAFYGSTGNIRLNRPIVGMASTPTGRGYWLVASDGGIFAFGDAAFYGSTGNLQLAQPIVAMAATATGAGYRFVAADGGVFTFGDATFAGAGGTGSRIVGLADSGSDGYWLAGSDGNVIPFGSVKSYGSLAGVPLNRPIVGVSP